MGKSYIVIEGRGENGSVEHLLRKLSIDLGHPEAFWKVGGRTTNLKSASALIQQCEKLRARGDCDRALLLQDDEDGCPREEGDQPILAEDAPLQGDHASDRAHAAARSGHASSVGAALLRHARTRGRFPP